MSKALVPIFFLSGVAALVFETLWFRLAGLALGNSVWSATLVLAAFMGGLTLGNAWVASRRRRPARPVRLYACLEIAIGVAGFAVVLILPRLSATAGPLLSTLVETPWLLNAVRLAIAFSLLVIPASAMGATLPLLTETLVRSNPNFGLNLGKLYGWNTLGSMCGALATELVLVGAFGIVGTGLVALCMNLAAGLFALRLSGSSEGAAAPSIADETRPALSRRTYRYLLVGFLSGAAMLALEVIWFRFLLLAYLGTALCFALMLAVVLGGIGLGGLAAGRLARTDEHCHRWLRHLSAASALLVVATYAGFDLFTAGLIDQPPTLAKFAAFAAFLTLPVSVLSGAAFTMVARAVNAELGSSVRSAATAALWNTVGSMAGSLCAGFLLLPLAGMERSFCIVAAVYCAIAILARSPTIAGRRWASASGRAAIALAIASLALFPFGLMQRSFFKIIERALPNQQLIATREGVLETVRYYRSDFFGAPHFYRLVTNGFSMSATTPIAKRYMKLYVYLPLALREQSKDALLISFGVGSTAKALTDSAGLRHIDVVDISRDILDMSSILFPDGDNPLSDPRVQVHVEDGRFFLSSTRRTYDLITSEPPPPKVAGVVNLYTEEYFKLIRKHLVPGGYASYWVPVHDLQPADTLAIIKAFCNAFEDCSLWSGAGLEWMLMGSNGATGRVTAESFSAQWRDERVRSELTAVGFEAPEQMGSLFMGDAGQLAAVTANVEPVTDNYPLRISYRLMRDHGPVPLYAALLDENRRIGLFRASPFIADRWPPELRESSEPYFNYERMIKDHFTEDVYRTSDDPFLWEDIDDVLTHTKLETLPLWLLGSDVPAQRIATAVAPDADAQNGIDVELALGALARRDFPAALAHSQRVIGDGKHVTLGEMSLYIYSLAKSGEVAAASQILHAPNIANAPGVGAYRDWFDKRFDVTRLALQPGANPDGDVTR